ncbi:CHAD domain-containing protein [Leptolyngbya sp. FACHB-16]|uniref:CHAD domain-containing protein n=1 Tax=unclassified Leptolyngbya TaxID=2650499 RepID=UPI001682B6D4|nr:CHAD domain-containing protein [Leptolyngbya sp. FACHB-16]MBD2152943.1 CHAD domain-containing protein [Leptolyngbya sp. FACHB-16]
MVTLKNDKTLQQIQHPDALGEWAYEVIQKQYHHVIKQEKKVLVDQNPEPLHQMRVGTRRLRTALQVFESAVSLPKTASEKRLRDLARVLGEVRDLDVQLASLQEDYRPHLGKREQKYLDQVIDALYRRRKKSFNSMKEVLTQPSYKVLKTTYTKWLEHPQYTAIAQIPLQVVLPDLLSPLLSHLLLHPAWLISTEQALHENSVMLHDLRKACKHARYQAEFFTSQYGEDFRDWIEDVKQLQAQLGTFQDIQVLLDLLTHELGKKIHFPDLQALVTQRQMEALSNWEGIRLKYLKPNFRNHLYQMILTP